MMVASFGSFQAAQAGTIIKLSLGDTGPDLAYAGGVLSTVDDGIAGTPGDQNTAIDFLDFLSGETDIPLADASYSLSGVTAAGPASVLFGVVVVQPFTSGNFKLWDDSNALLLDVDLDDSALTGPLGPAATGSVFSITNGTVVGGSLASQIISNSISMSIAMTSINGGAGLAVAPLAPPIPGMGTLLPFVADASKVIAAEPVPEPTSALLILMGLLAAPLAAKRRR